MDTLVALPKDRVADLVDLAERAQLRLASLEPRDPLHDALSGAIAAVRLEIRTLATV